MEPGSPIIRLSVAICIFLASLAVLPILWCFTHRKPVTHKRLNQGQIGILLIKFLFDAALFILAVLELPEGCLHSE